MTEYKKVSTAARGAPAKGRCRKQATAAEGREVASGAKQKEVEESHARMLEVAALFKERAKDASAERQSSNKRIAEVGREVRQATYKPEDLTNRAAD